MTIHNLSPRLLHWGSVLLSVILLFSGCGGTQPEAPPQVLADPSPSFLSRAPVSPPPKPLLECLFYEPEEFQQSVQDHPTYRWEGKARAGIVPHHLLAADMIAGFFSAIAQQNSDYQRVLIFSTAHYSQEIQGDITTTSLGWNTPFGPLPADPTFFQTLLRQSALEVKTNDAAFEKDHGIAALIPYVKYFLPQAAVGVCLVPNQLSTAKALALRECFLSLSDEDTLIIGSIDFSHYLTPQQSALKEQETMEAIKALDIERVAQFDDDHVDSPVVLAALLHLTVNTEGNLLLLDHSSSPEKLRRADSNPFYQEGITTYFTYAIT